MTTVTQTQVLKTAIDNYGHTAPLKDGSVKPENIMFDHLDVQPIIAAFRRMVRGLEFDVCEMAITTYITARAYNKPITALPIFVLRMLNHSAMSYNVKSGIQSPKDVEGKRMGVRAYTVTQGVWCRGLLSSEFGVDPDKVNWVLVDEEHVQEFKYPPNVSTAEKGKTMGDLLLAGEIDAAIGAGRLDSPDIKPLIPDARNAEAEWARRVGFTPINHLVVVKNSVLESAPWIAPALFEAFKESKVRSLARIKADGPKSPSDEQVARNMEIMGGADPLPYGIEPNRKAIEAVIGYAHEQHILPRHYDPEELFAAGTLDLMG